MEEQKNIPDCCKPKKQNSDNKGIKSGIIYGLVPHIGCIAFIVFTVLGVTAATTMLKPLMVSRYFFYVLIAAALALTTISAAIYLRRTGCLSIDGIKQRWKYLSIMYGTTIVVNLAMFMIIFPIAANMATGTATQNLQTFNGPSLNTVTLQVDIPCPGHAPLIIGELKTVQGVQEVKFRFPNKFNVTYDPSKTSKEEMLSLEIFKDYPAQTIEQTKQNEEGCKELCTA